MSTSPLQVIVAAFSTEDGAAETFKALKASKREKLIALKEAAVLRRDVKNKIHIKEVHDVGAGKGAVAGGLIGVTIALLAGPAGLVVSSAAGALVGAVAAKQVDVGLPNDQLKILAGSLAPGTSMLVAIIEHRWMDDLRETLQGAGARVVMADALRKDLTAQFGEGETRYAAYVDGQAAAPAQAQAVEDDLFEVLNIGSTEQGVVVRTHVLTTDGLVDRAITISERGIVTEDTPVQRKRWSTETTVTVSSLEAEAARLVEAVKDQSESRYKLRLHFYSRYGRSARTAGYGNSELGFMRWEINRGVLNPLNDPQQPGSPWWREVNGRFLYYSELALLAEEAGLGDADLPAASRYWIDYMRQPSAANWYRAHNRSIVEGYIQYASLAEQENEFEQFFMNEVLFRVIYASAMVTGRAFGALGKAMSHPGLPAVDILVSVPHFYPQSYPMTFADKMHVLHQGYSLREKAVKVLDEWFVLPQLTELYAWSAEWLGTPELNGYITHDQPSYPKPRA
jgi:uncharacterized membrane protein